VRVDISARCVEWLASQGPCANPLHPMNSRNDLEEVLAVDPLHSGASASAAAKQERQARQL